MAPFQPVQCRPSVAPIVLPFFLPVWTTITQKKRQKARARTGTHTHKAWPVGGALFDHLMSANFPRL